MQPIFTGAFSAWDKALCEIEQLRKAVAKRWERTKETDPWIRREKVVRYFVGKGFGREEVEGAL